VDGGGVGPGHHDDDAFRDLGPAEGLGREESGGLVALDAALDHDGGAGFLAAQEVHLQGVLGARKEHDRLGGNGNRGREEQ